MDQLLAMARPASPTAAAPHVAHKIPSGDGPYARAKHFQVIKNLTSIYMPAKHFVAIQLGMHSPLLLERFLWICVKND
jgi:hypothetical protein